jgi:hypothetical protein
MTTPTSASLMPCVMTIRRIAPRPAPSATRTPISWVRCATEYESTPYTPIDARTSATTPNAPNIQPNSRQKLNCRNSPSTGPETLPATNRSPNLPRTAEEVDGSEGI